MSNPRFPLFVNLTGKKILVFGGGTIGSRRVETLLPFGADITVIAQEVSSALEAYAREGTIRWIPSSYKKGQITTADIVLAATDDASVNQAVYEECKSKLVPVNVASDQTKCDFFFPAIVREGDLVIGMTASGKNHKKVKEAARRLRNQMKTIRIGSRESKLAVIQSQIVIDYLRKAVPDRPTRLVTMKTTGDRILDRSLDQIGGKGLFVKELDQALLDQRSDFSVHSLKDMPMEIPEELPLLGFSQREDPRDVLVLPIGKSLWDKNLPVGCSSRRRMIQFDRLEPGLTFQPVRGNVLTRLEKLDRGEYGALILAAAGLKRLGLEHRISRYFTEEEMIPAAGQGILALQGRRGEDYSYLDDFFDSEAMAAAMAERAFVKALDGGCSSPIGAFARVEEDQLHLRGLYYSENKRDFIVGSLSGNVNSGEMIGRELARQLRHSMGEGI